MIRVSQCSTIEAAFHLAWLWAKLRSKGTTKVGAAVVHEPSQNIFLGYNGFPAGVPDEDTVWSTARKHDFVIHAEINAMRKATASLGQPLEDCVLVCTMRPCLACLREIAANKIKHVVYAFDDAGLLSTDNNESGARLAREAGIRFQRLAPLFEPTMRAL